MRIAKRVSSPERSRHVPEHFSRIDHRLVREHFIEKADVDAWALCQVPNLPAPPKPVTTRLEQLHALLERRG